MSEVPVPELRTRVGLRWKIVGLCGASMALAVTAAVFALVLQARRVLLDALEEQARTVSVQLAETLSFGAASRNELILRSAAEGVLRGSPKVAYIAFRSPSGELLGAARAGDLPEDAAQAAGLPGAQRSRELDLGGVHVVEAVEQIRSADVFAADGAAQDVVGTVQVGLRADILRAQVADITLRSLGVAGLVFLACLAAAAAVARMVTTPLVRLSAAAAGVARGDLRQDVKVSGNDEIAGLAGSFRWMATGLRGMAVDLQQAAGEVDGEATRILSTAAQQAAMSAQQASAIQETSTTIAEIAQTAKHATEHADEVIRIAQRSEDLSAEGERSVEQAASGIEAVGAQVRAIATAIGSLSERSARIGELVATVREVSEQSHVLALNAALEASKAGEHGRGFAVVASELRRLAEQSRGAAAEVRGQLAGIRAGTRAAVEATEEGGRRADAAVALARTAGETIVGLAEVIRASSLAAKRIANETRQQTIGVDQIVAAISDVSSAMQESVEGTRRIETSTASLAAVSGRLTGIVERYQV